MRRLRVSSTEAGRPTDSPLGTNPWLSQNSLQSAERLVPLILRYVRPGRVVDLGCKHGEWLSVFKQRGVSTVLGVDQQKRSGWLAIGDAEFRAADLNEPLVLPEAFDLAVCVEVAEHLRAASAPILIETLTTAAHVVLFSAATPGQGGHGHVNEQPRAYWHGLFARHGFMPIDCLRPQIWQELQIAFWYRQNLFFYANDSGLELHPELAGEAVRQRADDLELVHV